MVTNIPYLLTEDQKKAVCVLPVETVPTIQPEFSALLTGDETRVHYLSDSAVTKYGATKQAGNYSSVSNRISSVRKVYSIAVEKRRMAGQMLLVKYIVILYGQA